MRQLILVAPYFATNSFTPSAIYVIFDLLILWHTVTTYDFKTGHNILIILFLKRLQQA